MFVIIVIVSTATEYKCRIGHSCVSFCKSSHKYDYGFHSALDDGHSPPSPNVGDGGDPTEVLHEDDPGGAEVRSNGDVETSVAVQQSGVIAV